MNRIKVGVMMCALREHKMIVPAIRQFDNLKVSGVKIADIIVACSKTSWNGKVEGDDTAELAIRAGATVKLHDWKDEKDQKNWILDRFKDVDWVLLFAPDMFMTKNNLVGLLKHLRIIAKEKDRGVGCEMINYWRNWDTAIYPHAYFGTLAIRPTERFDFSSTVKNYEKFKTCGAVMHHLIWVRSDKDMEIKLKTWSHAKDVTKGWFKEVWQKWDGQSVVTDPLDPTYRYELVEQSLPTELKELIYRYKL
jgi:hypothetical protein